MSSTKESTSSKPANLEESKLNSASAIKKMATLSDADFKSFHEQAMTFVETDDGRCAALPRALTNQKWAELIDELVDELGLGGEFWNAERKGFNPDTDLLYPEDTEHIRLIVFSMLKCEVIRQAKTKKRGNEGEESIKQPPAKKSRVSQAPKDKDAGKTPAKKEKAKTPATALKAPVSKEKSKTPAAKKAASTTASAKPKAEPTTTTASKPTVVPSKSDIPKPSVEVKSVQVSASPVPTTPESTHPAAGDDNIELMHQPSPPAVTATVPMPTPTNAQGNGVSGSPGAHHDIFTPALIPLRAVTEPPNSARDLLQIAGNAINGAAQPLGAPLVPWKSLKFRVQVMASDPEITIALAQERQAHTLKPIDLQWETFLGTVMHGLHTYKHQIAFVLANQVRVRTAFGIYTFNKAMGGCVWKEVMNNLVDCNDEAAVDVIFFP